MKKTLHSIAALLLSLAMTVCLFSCFGNENSNDPWDSATYAQDTEFGNGAITVRVEVKVEDKSVTFTIHTDKTTLADTLLEHNLIAGTVEEYGLYVKTVNGILADFDVDQHYWAFYKNGEYLMTGADTTYVSDGEHYEIVYSK